ncbi:MAG: ABC transporter permease subunit [Metamycoplasmataceae bacterium]
MNWAKNIFKQKRTALFIPYLVFFTVFILIPLIFILITSFLPIPGEESNDSGLIIDGFWPTFWKSIFVSIGVSVICFLISMPYVFIISQIENKSIKISLLLLIISPIITFTLVKILALKGLFTFIFDERSINNSFFLIIGLIYLNLPFMIIPLYNVFSNMPKNLLNASEDLGYNKIQTFIKVVIPYGLKAICSGITIVFLLSVMSIAVSDKLLINPEQNQTVGNLINGLANPNNPFDMRKASTIILVSMLIMGGIFILINSIPLIYRKIRGGMDE